MISLDIMALVQQKQFISYELYDPVELETTSHRKQSELP